MEKGERDGRTYTRVGLAEPGAAEGGAGPDHRRQPRDRGLLASAGELLDQAERYRSELGMRNHAE